MDVIRFALGFRFDPIEEGDEAARAASAFVSCVDNSLLQGLKMYAGHYKLNENDDGDILTLIIMGGGLKLFRKIYREAKSCRYLMSLLTDFRPIIQSNVMFKIDGFDYYGEFAEDRKLIGGDKELVIEPLEKDLIEKAAVNHMTVLLAPDKYKGTFDQFAAVRMLKQTARRILPGAMLISAPCADGGDGTASVICRALNGKTKKATVTGPEWELTDAEYCVVKRDTAVVEMASASGLALLKNPPDPLNATSRGTGELIADALKNKIKKLMICLGGSATNDGGMGAAIALGVKLLDPEGRELDGCGANMELVKSIDITGLEPKLKEVEISVLCDVTNPLTGENGATYTFGPQKGAEGESLIKLEKGMKNLEKLYNDAAGQPVCGLPGAGAAGGMGAMLAALLGAKLVNGAEAVLEATGFKEKLGSSDIVVTGEGCFDRTSTASGKAVGAVINAARKSDVPCYILAGTKVDGAEKNAAKVFCAYDWPVPDEELKSSAAQKFMIAAEELFKTAAKEV